MTSPLVEHRISVLEEDLAILGIYNPRYIRTFRSIWANGPGDTRTTKEVLASLDMSQLGYVRRQIDNSYRAVTGRHIPS